MSEGANNHKHVPIGMVYQTYDYGCFKMVDTYNRDVDMGHVNTIKESIRKHGFLHNPLVVNEKMEIINGQHRFTALKELQMPIIYVIGKGLRASDIAVFNSAQSNWLAMHFIKSYAACGNVEYQKLLQLSDETGITETNALAWAGWGFGKAVQSGMSTTEIKNGAYKFVEDYEVAKEVCNYISSFDDFLRSKKQSPRCFYACVGFAYKNIKTLNPDRLHKK